MSSAGGIFTVSLDFELYWGMRDVIALERYRANLEGVHQAVPALLQYFSAFGVHTTWATVGFLFFRDSTELRTRLPALRPAYRNAWLDPYAAIPDTERHPELIPLYYAPELVSLIHRHQQHGQEIASHSFSHYYAGEPGTDGISFRADLEAVLAVARRQGIPIGSHVFPRQQYGAEELDILSELGFRAFRGSTPAFIHRFPERHDCYFTLKRGLRFADALINLSGHHDVEWPQPSAAGLVNVAGSRFFHARGPSETLNHLRLQRVLRGMTQAARTNRIFHLWWHPHNFGIQLQQNLQRLEQVLLHY
ncbi:MAG: DUF2334 domain-containing protein, partial [Thiothrix sp.]|nr:DUF2334 domain-containing protein [Thiothrix sp.]